MNEHLINVYVKALIYRCTWLDSLTKGPRPDFDAEQALADINKECGDFDLQEEEAAEIIRLFRDWQEIPF